MAQIIWLVTGLTSPHFPLHSLADKMLMLTICRIVGRVLVLPEVFPHPVSCTVVPVGGEASHTLMSSTFPAMVETGFATRRTHTSLSIVELL